MRKMFLTTGLFMIIVFFLACKCDLTDKSYSIFIDNESEIIISSYLALGGTEGIAYPDTTLSFEKKWVGYDTNPGNRAYQALFTFTYEEWFARLPQDTLSIFIFSKDTLAKYDWSEVQSDYKILQRYDLSSEDFKRLFDKNGVPVITYPPTAAMKEMKMYPPYQ